MSGFVGAQHEFHDAAFVQGWADRLSQRRRELPCSTLYLEFAGRSGLGEVIGGREPVSTLDG